MNTTVKAPVHFAYSSMSAAVTELAREGGDHPAALSLLSSAAREARAALARGVDPQSAAGVALVIAAVGASTAHNALLGGHHEEALGAARATWAGLNRIPAGIEAPTPADEGGRA